MRVQTLIERMRAGDSEAASEVRRRLADGDPEVTREVGRRLAEGDIDFGKQLVSPDPDRDLDADNFQAELANAADLTTSYPATTGPLMQRLSSLAARLGTCQAVQVLGLNAMRLSLLGDLQVACAELKQARVMIGDCRACDLDTTRREALLLLHLGEKELSLAKSQTAMDGYEIFGAPGHDLNGHGLASSQIARAQIRCALGDYAGSAADCAAALPHFPRDSKVWKVTHQNLASTLALSGPAGYRKVNPELAALRLQMRKGVSVERAAFLWLDGQLVVAIGERRYRGRKRLTASLQLYGDPKIALPGPWLGVAADYARAIYPDREALARWMAREVAPHVSRLVKDELHLRQLAKLHELCECRRRPRSIVRSGIRSVVESLRDSVSAPIPCLLPWRDG